MATDGILQAAQALFDSLLEDSQSFAGPPCTTERPMPTNDSVPTGYCGHTPPTQLENGSVVLETFQYYGVGTFVHVLLLRRSTHHTTTIPERLHTSLTFSILALNSERVTVE
jgi:hypothetical protein